MAGLTIQGDPGGWSDAGGSLSALAARLETGLSDADALGAQALARSWAGPAAAAFSAHWATRHPRYEDLIVLVRRAARAILAYAHTLEDMRARAVNLESAWCGVGLHVLYSGEGFMLPPGVESMPPHAQVSLRQALSESARDVEALGADCVAAAAELAAVLIPVIALLDDFALIELNIIRGIGAEFINEQKDPLSLAGTGLEVAERFAGDAADNAGTYASQLSYYLREGTAGERSAAGSLLPGAGQDAAFAGSVSDLAKWGGSLALAAGTGFTVWKVMHDGQKVGYRASLEEHSGEIASTAFEVVAGDAVGAAAAGVILAAGAPEIVAAIGAVAVVGVAAAGVGYTVQSVVNHRRAIEHFVDSVL
jgi:uncharacterized protein YukE